MFIYYDIRVIQSSTRKILAESVLSIQLNTQWTDCGETRPHCRCVVLNKQTNILL